MDEIAGALCRLRRARAETLARMSQADVVGVVCEWAGRWRDERYAFRREAEGLAEPFPFAMTRVSLDALLASLTPEALWALIAREGVRETFGCSLVGHVIAGNTPLLAWVSLLRALLMRSASFVKLPSGPAAEWGRLFVRSLADVSPALASTIHLAQWPGGTVERDAALCRNVDLVMAHGGDGAMGALRALCPPNVGFVGCGHRVSFGLVPSGAALGEAAWGFAHDVLLYDQGGCLSPHTVFVEGAWDQTAAFGERLASALAETVTAYPQVARSPQAAMRVREARLLARMGERTRVWTDADLRWTVIARPELAFALSPTHGVVSVQPLPTLEALPQALAPVAGDLQGCAVAGEPGPASGVLSRPGKPVHPSLGGKGSDNNGAPRLSGPAKTQSPIDSDPFPPREGWTGLPGRDRTLRRDRISRLCAPGELQAPPFSWRQDGRDVLRTLLPGRGQDD